MEVKPKTKLKHRSTDVVEIKPIETKEEYVERRLKEIYRFLDEEDKKHGE